MPIVPCEIVFASKGILYCMCGMVFDYHQDPAYAANAPQVMYVTGQN